MNPIIIEIKMKEESKQLNKKVEQVKLTKSGVVDALQSIEIQKDGEKYKFGVKVLDDRVEVYKGKEVALVDIFASKKNTPEEYAKWLKELIFNQFEISDAK